MGRFVFVGGGARSGKSRFALERARALGARRAFVATAQALDAEMADRIARHARERGDTFRTVEAPLDVADALRRLEGVDVALVDCLTLWLANLVLRGDPEHEVLTAVDALADAVVAAPFPVVLVTNEVGMGIVPEAAVARVFRDVTGRAHQVLSARADEVHFAVMGCILRLKPGPVALATAAP